MVRNWGLIKHKIFFKRLSFSFKKTKSYSARIKDQRKRLNFFCYFGGGGGDKMQCCCLIFRLLFFVKIQRREFIFAHSSINSCFFLVQTNFQNRTSVMMMRGEFEEDRKIFRRFSTFSLTESSSDMWNQKAFFASHFATFFSDCIFILVFTRVAAKNIMILN